MPEEFDDGAEVIGGVEADEEADFSEPISETVDDDETEEKNGGSSGPTQNVPEENIERVQLPERDDVQEIDTGTDTQVTQSDIGGGGERGTAAIRQEIDEEGRAVGEPEVVGGASSGKTPRQALQETRERRQDFEEERQQPSQDRQAQAQQDRQRIDPTRDFNQPTEEERRQIIDRLGRNIERPDNIPAPTQPSITAEAPERDQAFLFSTNREFAQGTDIPGESFFDRIQPTTTGVEGTGITRVGEVEAFPSPSAQGLQTQREVSDILQGVGVDEGTARSVGRSIGTTETLGRSATTGIAEAPEQVSRFLEDPEEEIERTIEGLERTETGQVATTPEQAVILGGTDVQERARIRQESFGAELALSGLGTSGAGIAAGGAVRGVNAPTTRFTRTQPDIETERFQGQFLEDRLAASETEVTEAGEIAQGQQFVEIGTRGQTRGIIGEESTQGITEQPLTFIRAQDPEGTRTFAARTTAGFEATDQQTEGLARTQLLEISRDQEIQDFEGITSETQLQDFTAESVSDEIIRGRAGDTQLSDIESALFGESAGEEFRGLARIDVRQQRDQGVTETFSRVEGAAQEDQPTVAEGTFITEENLEQVGISRRIDADERFDTPETELTEQDLQDLEQISEDLFGEDVEEASQTTDTDFETDDTTDRDTGEGQQLIQEEPDREMTEFEEQTLGVGVEQAAQEAAETGVRRNIEREFEPLDTNAFDDVTGSIISGTSISTTDTDQLTGFGQEQEERQGTRQRQGQQLELGETQREEQEQITNQLFGQDTEQETQQRQRLERTRQRPPRQFDFTPRRTPGGGGGFGFDFGGDQTSQTQAVQETSGERGFQRQASIDAIISGDVQTVSEEEFEELQEEEFTGLESRSILRVENGNRDENNDDLNRQLGI